MLPTMDEIMDIWNVGEAPDEDDEEDDEAAKLAKKTARTHYRRKIDLLLWYLDRYLPNLCGLEFWGPQIRPYHLMTDLVNLQGDTSGKKKVLVTVTSEAFALLMYENCREKWINTFQLKKQNKKAKIPAYKRDDEATHKYANLWSNSSTGSVKGGGWSIDALKKLITNIKHVQAFRSLDNAEEFMNFGKSLIVAANQVSDSQKRAREQASDAEQVALEDEVQLEYIEE